MGTIFISYRRADSGGEAGRLYDRLADRFGADRVFRDLDTIEPGRRFPKEIAARLASCDAMVAVIGPAWAGPPGDAGVPRIQREDDYVRMELAAALDAGVPLIPVLLHNTAMPDPATLPPDLGGLAQFQAMEVDDADFHEDAARLVAALERIVAPGGGRTRRRVAVGLVLAVAALAVAAVVAPRLGGPARVALRAEPATLSSDDVRALIVRRDYPSTASNPGGAGLEHAFVRSLAEGAPVVTDRATGLTWERGGSAGLVSGGREGALSRVRTLNGSRHGGFDDWRLPTLDEALSLLGPPGPGGFHLDPAFDAMGAPFVWTADDEPGGRGWVVYYLDGYAAAEAPAYNAYVRAVRGTEE